MSTRVRNQLGRTKRMLIRLVMSFASAVLTAALVFAAGIVAAGLGLLHQFPAFAAVGLTPAVEVYAGIAVVAAIGLVLVTSWWSRQE